MALYDRSARGDHGEFEQLLAGGLGKDGSPERAPALGRLRGRAERYRNGETASWAGRHDVFDVLTDGRNNAG